MATITRDNLITAVRSCNEAFVSPVTKVQLHAWAHKASEFNIADWNNCPLDQIGAVRAFERRHKYVESENEKFANAASEIDAQILPFVETDIAGELINNGLTVTVV